MRKPNLLWGALVGGVFMIPLMAVSYLGQQAARLAFAPFDLFDWMARNLPEQLINFGRNSISDVVSAIQVGNTSNTAKAAENLMGISLVIVIGVIAGALFFFLMNRIKLAEESSTPGMILGIIVSLPFLLFTFTVNLDSMATPLIAVIWIVVLFVLWGLGTGWAYNRLHVETPSQEAQPAVSAQAIDRRTFLIQLGAASATITVVGAGLGAFINGRNEEALAAQQALNAEASAAESTLLADLPNANDPVQPVVGTRPEVTPVANHYRIDIRSDPQGLIIPAEDYQLEFINGLDNSNPLIAALTLDDIKTKFDPVSAYITMSCISNRIGGDLISTTKWTGARMKDILDSIEVPPRATHLKIYGGDGFDETVALDLINNDDRVMLCYYWEDQALTTGHGFPLRIHIPNHYGMKQPKWIIRMEFIEGDQEGYWVRRGWDKDAFVRATSVIDTIATDMMIIDKDNNKLIPIGGIAWAGDRGISKVEVRVDDGDWAEAQIRSAISDRTWNIWRYDWPFVEGSHTFEVRCTEKDGTPQIQTTAPVQPSGATGYNTVRTTI